MLLWCVMSTTFWLCAKQLAIQNRRMAGLVTLKRFPWHLLRNVSMDSLARAVQSATESTSFLIYPDSKEIFSSPMKIGWSLVRRGEF